MVQGALRLAVILLLASSIPASHSAPEVTATSVKLRWDRNVETNIDHYTLYFGHFSKLYSKSATTKGRAITVNVPWRKAFFVVTATNTKGQESNYSNEATWP